MTSRWPALLAVFLLATCGGDDDGGGGGGGGADAAVQTPSRVRDYIRAAPFPKLVLEIDAVAGFMPRTASVSAMLAELDRILDKPGGVTASLTTALTSRGADHAWTFTELDALATSTFDFAAGGDATKIHVLFLDGHHADDTQSSKILGLAWANTHLVIFKKTIEDNCRDALPLLSEELCRAAEQSIWLHELGHVIGLVDNGLAMVAGHEDGAHPAHDSSDDCVMYWAYEGKGAIDTLIPRVTGGNQSALAFDAACLADIAAVRGN